MSNDFPKNADRRCLLSVVLMCLVGSIVLGQSTVKYPQTHRVDQVDDYHGTKIADPYRWLEQDVRESEEVANWIDAENQVTFGFLERLPYRERIQKRLKELWDYAKYSAPFKAGPYYFYFKNDGLQNQSVLYVTEGLDGEPRILIDPNAWSSDGTIALAGFAPSDTGRYLAFAKAASGSDWQTWHVLDVATGKELSDQLDWVKFSSADWTKDDQGFFYSRYDEPAAGATFQSLNLNQKVYYHRLGQPQSKDTLVYARPDQPEYGFGATVSEDNRYLVITVWKGTDDKYLVYYRDLTDPYAFPRELIGKFEHEYAFLANDGPIFYFKTNDGAPRGRVIAIDTRQPGQEHWREIIPETAETMLSTGVIGEHFIVQYLKDARSQVKVHAMDGRFVREVPFPELGTASGFGGKRDDAETFYSFASFTRAPTIYRYDVRTGESKEFRRDAARIRPEDFEVKQVFVTSKDGTRVPMFLAHRKGLKLDGTNPTLLYGYGGFNIPLTPVFSISRLVWMEMGGVFAMPNLRGGGEYGEEWHEAGKLDRKQNVFDDFIAAAEWLIQNDYTRAEKIAIQGRSNGGLLVGAVMTQRPDLFGACLPGVGVMDMLRFHQFTAGRFWVDEYGSADDAQQFEVLRKYSPYHNLKVGIRYPATMITTADTDDRVVPGHSFKFAAALQHAHRGEPPVLIRVETKAGHGAGKPTEKIIEEVADEFAFLVATLGFQPWTESTDSAALEGRQQR